MSLYVIATPIGDPKELSASAIEILADLDLLICESRKETSRLLRGVGVRPKEYEELSEHSTKEDIELLLEKCSKQKVGLVSDCGTPGFCDPGALLVKACHERSIPVRSVPGPSCLMAFLSVLGEDVQEFYFKGFLSQKTEVRKEEILNLKKNYISPIVLMDTPYRMKKTLLELELHWSNCRIAIGGQLGMSDEFVIKGTPDQVLKALPMEKAEFILMVFS